MPAVTQTRRAKYNVNGNLREQYYQVTGASGDTLVVGMNAIRFVDVQAPITGTTVTAGPLPGTSTITFAASGAFTAANVQVLGV